MELDDALIALGDFGLYQTIIYILICTAGQVPSVWHMLVINFTGATPKHHCRIPSGKLINETIPVVKYQNGEPVYSSCQQYANFTYGNETTSCTNGWWYDNTDYGNTVVTEWDLVCNKAGLANLPQIIYMTGVMFGSLLFGQLSDRYGRRVVWFLSLWTQVIFGVAAAFSPNFITFNVLTFCIGLIVPGINITSYVMVTEMFSAKKRAVAGVMLTNFWAGGLMALAGIAYLIRDWRYLQFAISVPSLITIPMWWVIPESMRWLISKGKLEKAETVLQRIARFNKVLIPEGGFLLGKEHQEIDTGPGIEGAKGYLVGDDTSDDDPLIQVKGHTYNEPIHSDARKYYMWDLFRTAYLRKVSVIMLCTWFVVAVVYYGLSLNTGNLAGDPYIDFFLSGAVEVPAYIISVIVITRFGRRLPLCIFHIFGGVACIIAAFIPQETDDGTNIKPVIVTTAMLGKFGIAGAYAIVFLYASELFPTVARNLGVGMSAFSSRVGGIAAPFIMYLATYFPQAPMIIFGGLSTFTGLLVLLLPETLNMIQPQTLEDAETLHTQNSASQ